MTAERGRIESELPARRVRKAQINEFVDALHAGVMTEFDEEVFRAVVDSITVGEDGGLSFRFVDGSEIVVGK